VDTLGAQFARALAAKDFARISELFHVLGLPPRGLSARARHSGAGSAVVTTT
jgi:hypothetical protein